jgi:hypothetical protein
VTGPTRARTARDGKMPAPGSAVRLEQKRGNVVPWAPKKVIAMMECEKRQLKVRGGHSPNDAFANLRNLQYARGFLAS